MIEYKVEFIALDELFLPLFNVVKYVDGKQDKVIKTFLKPNIAHAIARRIIEGEGTYIVIPKVVKEVRYV